MFFIVHVDIELSKYPVELNVQYVKMFVDLNHIVFLCNSEMIFFLKFFSTEYGNSTCFNSFFQTFDRYRCAKLVMECLCQFNDPSMNRMSVAICSILAAKVRMMTGIVHMCDVTMMICQIC